MNSLIWHFRNQLRHYLVSYDCHFVVIATVTLLLLRLSLCCFCDCPFVVIATVTLLLLRLFLCCFCDCHFVVITTVTSLTRRMFQNFCALVFVHAPYLLRFMLI
ncbi:hypothetical protein CANARDRAFT_30489, partial [[Candida] arabinofermentans NRRL YB-2248]